MDVAVANDSPLGQYLAELAALDEPPSASLSAQQQPPASAPDHSKRESTQRAQGRLQYSQSLQQIQHRIASQWRRMRSSAQRLVLEQLLRCLDDQTNIRDAVLEAAGLGSELPRGVHCWLLPTVQIQGMSNDGFLMLMVTVMVGISAFTWTFDTRTVRQLWFLGLLALVSLELIYQALVVYYSQICRQFTARTLTSSQARSDLQTAFTQAIDIVKRSELVARGYRLGRVLPPIGRLEESSSARDPQFQLQCRRLRLRLRDANDAFEQASRAVVARVAIPTTVSLSSALNEDLNSATPSLLVSTLAKRRELSEILLESALREVLVDDLARLVRGHDDEAHDEFAQVLSQQARTYETLNQLMGSWSQELSRWCTRLLPSESHRDEKRENIAQVAVGASAVKVPREVSHVSHALVEFQASCETLTALAMASQHDIVDCIASSANCATSESASVEFDQVEWRGKLQRSRDQMAKLMQQLTRDWELLERAADDAKNGGATAASVESEQIADERVVCESQAENFHDKQRAALKGQQDAERDYLLVFTATSTGEKDFDLQELLRQQRLDDDGRLQPTAAPIPSFVGELQNVLEQRTALPSAPMLVKRIGDELPLLPSKSQPLQLQPQSESVVPRAIDLQQLLQSQFAAQLHEESFGASSNEEDD